MSDRTKHAGSPEGSEGYEETGQALAVDPEVAQILAKLLVHHPDAHERLQDLVAVVLGTKDMAETEAVRVLQDTLDQYENRLRVGMVGVARAKLSRYVKLAKFVDAAESVLFKEDRLARMSTTDLVRVLVMAEKTMKTDLEFIDRTVEMRLRQLGVESLVGLHHAVMSGMNVIEVEGESIELTPNSRTKLRTILSKLHREAEQQQDG